MHRSKKCSHIARAAVAVAMLVAEAEVAIVAMVVDEVMRGRRRR